MSMAKGTTKNATPMALVLVALGCGGRAEMQTNAAGAAGASGHTSAGGYVGVINGIPPLDSLGGSGDAIGATSGGAPSGASSAGAADVGVNGGAYTVEYCPAESAPYPLPSCGVNFPHNRTPCDPATYAGCKVVGFDVVALCEPPGGLCKDPAIKPPGS